MIRILAVIAIFFLGCYEVIAQTPPPAAAAPLDGFTGLLLMGGIGAGYYALKGKDENK